MFTWLNTRDDLIRSDRHKTLFPYHHSACACRYHHIWPTSRSVSHLSISCSRGDRLTVTVLIFSSFYVFSVRGNSAINTSTNWSTSIRFFAIFSLTCYKYICSQLSCFSVLVSLISIVSVSIFLIYPPFRNIKPPKLCRDSKSAKGIGDTRTLSDAWGQCYRRSAIVGALMSHDNKFCHCR